MIDRRRFLQHLGTATAALVLAPACGGIRSARGNAVANRRDTVISTRGAYQVGLASWYGEQYAGRRTANGEIFDPLKISAAHRTLPFNSLVRVTNLENGRELVVRINDRGPFKKGRVIDLSRAGAARLGYKAQGLTQVRLDVERWG